MVHGLKKSSFLELANNCRSLENDDFSYATATYYLLAERVLASYREERAREAHAVERPTFRELSADFEKCRETRLIVGRYHYFLITSYFSCYLVSKAHSVVLLL